MVKLTTIRQSNARYASSQHDRRVCVFAGATSGIGASTLERMAAMLHNATFYVLGRSAARFASQRANLERLAPRCKVVFLETQVSLLADVDAACKEILAAEQSVDYLYMSPGLIPLNGAQCEWIHPPSLFSSEPPTQKKHIRNTDTKRGCLKTLKKTSKPASPSPTTRACASSPISSRSSAPPLTHVSSAC